MKRIVFRFFILTLGVFTIVGFGWRDRRNQRRAATDVSAEEKCTRLGWEKITIPVGGHDRQLLWNGPRRPWKHGTIIVMHGGGGNYTQWCHAPSAFSLVKPQVEFSHLAILEGFGVFLLDSTDDVVTDTQGLPCGKRFDATVVETRKSNVDLPFIGSVITTVIPSKRPLGSASEIFLTGESTGGFMATRAGTHFDGMVTAFAPAASADPYGTYFDCNPKLSPRTSAKGVGYDRETGKHITEPDACIASEYLHEQPWETQHPRTKPPFKTFHHEDDGIADLSCREKVGKVLAAHGYPDDGAYVIKGRGYRNAGAHLWQRAYNIPLLQFFKKQTR